MGGGGAGRDSKRCQSRTQPSLYKLGLLPGSLPWTSSNYRFPSSQALTSRKCHRASKALGLHKSTWVPGFLAATRDVPRAGNANRRLQDSHTPAGRPGQPRLARRGQRTLPAQTPLCRRRQRPGEWVSGWGVWGAGPRQLLRHPRARAAPLPRRRRQLGQRGPARPRPRGRRGESLLLRNSGLRAGSPQLTGAGGRRAAGARGGGQGRSRRRNHKAASPGREGCSQKTDLAFPAGGKGGLGPALDPQTPQGRPDYFPREKEVAKHSPGN